MLNFSRRINRRTFFVAFALNIVFTVVSLEIFNGLSSLVPHAGRLFERGSVIDDIIGVIEIIVLFGILIFSFIYYICIVRQRANDISGENAITLTFLSFLIFGWLLGFIPGQKHENIYGPVPKSSILVR